VHTGGNPCNPRCARKRKVPNVSNRFEVPAAEYGKWLSTYRWDWWCTLTFRLPPSPRTSLRHFHRFARTLEHHSGHRPAAFVASESGGIHGREHLHALVRFPSEAGRLPLLGEGGEFPTGEPRSGWLAFMRTTAWKWWFDSYGRALILDYDSDKKAAFYLAKYTTKTLAEWDVIGDFEKHELC